MDGWGKIKAVARYSGVSERTVESWLRDGLKCVRLPSGHRLIKYQWIDDFLEGFNDTSCQDGIDRIVEEVVRSVGG